MPRAAGGAQQVEEPARYECGLQAAQVQRIHASASSLWRYLDYATGILVTLHFILAPLEGIESRSNPRFHLKIKGSSTISKARVFGGGIGHWNGRATAWVTSLGFRTWCRATS